MEVQAIKSTGTASLPKLYSESRSGEGRKQFLLGEVNENSSLNTKEKISKMLEDIGTLKDKMDFELTVENVMKYKKMIKSFLHFYVENALTTHDIMSRSNKGVPERMTIVKKVEEGIEDLDDTLSLLDTKSGHLDMLRRIGEINGMIVDLKY